MSPPAAPPPPYNPWGGSMPAVPGYAPPPAVPMPPPKRDNTVKIVVIVIVVVAAVAISVPFMLYVMVSGYTPPPPPNSLPPTMVLQGAGSWSSSGNSTTYLLTVTSVSPSNANVNPADLQYIVSNSAQTPLYVGAAGQNTASGGYTINVLYSDLLDSGRVSAGDRIQVIVSPSSGNPLLGGRIAVNYQGNQIAVSNLA